MAQEKPLDSAVVQAWLSAWNERDIFSDAAVRHLQSLITDPLCLVVVTLGVGREPRSLVFRRIKQMIPVLIPPLPTLKPTLYAVQGDDGRFQIHLEKRQGEEGVPGKREGGKPSGVVLRQLTEEERTARAHALSVGSRQPPQLFPEIPVGPVAPVTPSVGQLWHQTGVKSETVPKSERVLRWDGTDWVIAGLVSDSATIMKQGLQVCDFKEALAFAHGHTKWLDCEFIYTYDGSTWGNA
jgi:hypothetical protein